MVGDAGLELRRIADQGVAVDTAKFLFHLADEPGVFLKQSPILGADFFGDAIEVIPDFIQNA